MIFYTFIQINFMKRTLLLAILLSSAFQANLFAQCAGAQTVTLIPDTDCYPAGQIVEFCYTMTNWNQVNDNWFHGLTFNFGAGWDSSSLVVVSLPASCDTNGNWSYYPQGDSATGTHRVFGAGFYYDSKSGSPHGLLDSIPGNNYGDNCSTHAWTFCFTLTISPIAALGASLNLSLLPTGDGTSGSWSNAGCNDSAYTLLNATVCGGIGVNLITSNVTCPGQCNGMAIATGYNGTPPYSYLWNTIPAQNTDTASNLCAGTYLVTVTDSTGAMGVQVVVIAQPNFDTTLTENICAGENFNGHNQTGNYMDTLTSSGGCDSVVTLNLTVFPVSDSIENVTICQGQTYKGYGVTGIYSDTLTSVNGCDSSYTLNLTVQPVSNTTFNHTICQGQSYQGHSTSGTYIDTFSNVFGCDSIRTLNLTVASTITTSLNQSICQGQSFEGYQTGGTYVDSFTAVGGCDSIRTLHLNVIPAYADTINQSICEGDTFMGHQTSGTYVDSLQSENGCDSLVTLNLAVNPTPAPPIITQNGDTLFANGGVTFQWYFGNNLIGGATGNKLIINQPGLFSVVITDSNGCNAQSTEYNVTSLSVPTIYNSPSLNIYPNPTNNLLNILISGLHDKGDVEIKLVDDLGQIVEALVYQSSAGNFNTQLKMEAYAAGVYTLQLKQGDWVSEQRVVIMRK
jgi:hypothetical protein